MVKKINVIYIYGGVGPLNTEFNWGVYDDASLYKFRYDVFDIMGQQNKIHFQIKFGYGIENLGVSLEKKVLGNEYQSISSISSKIRLKEVIHLADAFIIEIPGTTLFETLTTTKPILLLSPKESLLLTEEAQHYLRKRVLMAYNDREFITYLNDLIEHGEQSKLFTSVDSNNDEFLNKFIVPKGVNSFKEVKSFFKKIMEERRLLKV